MPVGENLPVDLERLIERDMRHRAMRHRALECFHQDGDHRKDVIFKS